MIILCSTVVGIFFEKFVKIFNKIKASMASDAKICRHTTWQNLLDIMNNTCFQYGHVCTHNKTQEQRWVRG